MAGSGTVRRTQRCCFFFFQAEDGIRDLTVTGVQTCALPICYAGVFAYGRSKTEKHLNADGNVITRQRRLPRGQWAVMIPGHHPGYISLETRSEERRVGKECRSRWSPYH